MLMRDFEYDFDTKQVTCDVGYLCANCGLPRPLCSRLRPDVRYRQADVRQTSDKASFNAPVY